MTLGGKWFIGWFFKVWVHNHQKLVIYKAAPELLHHKFGACWYKLMSALSCLYLLGGTTGLAELARSPRNEVGLWSGQWLQKWSFGPLTSICAISQTPTVFLKMLWILPFVWGVAYSTFFSGKAEYSQVSYQPWCSFTVAYLGKLLPFCLLPFCSTQPEN